MSASPDHLSGGAIPGTVVPSAIAVFAGAALSSGETARHASDTKHSICLRAETNHNMSDCAKHQSSMRALHLSRPKSILIGAPDADFLFYKLQFS